MSDNGIDAGRKKVPDGGGCVAATGPSCILSQVSVESGELDRLFSILSSRRRRWILYHLVSREEEVVERAELADVILAHERNDGQIEDPPPKATIVLDLHHGVLPRLKDEGFVDYDTRQGTIRYEGSPELADSLATIRILEQIGTEWRTFG